MAAPGCISFCEAVAFLALMTFDRIVAQTLTAATASQKEILAAVCDGMPFTMMIMRSQYENNPLMKHAMKRAVKPDRIQALLSTRYDESIHGPHLRRVRGYVEQFAGLVSKTEGTAFSNMARSSAELLENPQASDILMLWITVMCSVDGGISALNAALAKCASDCGRNGWIVVAPLR